MHASRRPVFVILSLLLALATLFASCTATEPDDKSGESTGSGDFDVAAGMRYGDTAYTYASTLYHPEGDRYLAQIGTFSHRRGDSVVYGGGSVQVRIGVASPVSGIYEVIGNHADSRTPLSMLPGKASIYTYGILENPLMSWSSMDSTIGAKIKVVVAGDSVQLIGKNIKLNNGKLISFNFKTAKPAP